MDQKPGFSCRQNSLGHCCRGFQWLKREKKTYTAYTPEIQDRDPKIATHSHTISKEIPFQNKHFWYPCGNFQGVHLQAE